MQNRLNEQERTNEGINGRISVNKSITKQIILTNQSNTNINHSKKQKNKHKSISQPNALYMVSCM